MEKVWVNAQSTSSLPDSRGGENTSDAECVENREQRLTRQQRPPIWVGSFKTLSSHIPPTLCNMHRVWLVERLEFKPATKKKARLPEDTSPIRTTKTEAPFPFLSFISFLFLPSSCIPLPLIQLFAPILPFLKKHVKHETERGSCLDCTDRHSSLAHAPKNSQAGLHCS